jgi:hypothetical protein
VQFVKLDRLGRGREPLKLEPVEVLGAAAGSFEEAVDGARVDVAAINPATNLIRESKDLAVDGGAPL